MTVQIIYDGECPLCSNYIKFVRLGDAAGPVELIDARGDHPAIGLASRAGLDLDDGMVMILDGNFYHGAEALHQIALMTTKSGFFNRLTYRIFRSPHAARMLYPLLRSMRYLLLAVLGRKRISLRPNGR